MNLLMSPTPLTRTHARYVRQLKTKKHRLLEQAFLVEGKKSVQELLRSAAEVKMLVCTPDFLQQEKAMLASYRYPLFTASGDLLTEVGSLKQNDQVLAVAAMQPNRSFTVAAGERALALDTLQDPGNLGTMMRIAQWYGIQKLICSLQTVDRYNPKVIQASMGAFTQVQTYYTPLAPFLKAIQVPVIGAVVQSEHYLHTMKLPSDGILLIGNESQGINPSLYPLLDLQVAIQKHGKVDSLNAAIATAILCESWCHPAL